MNGCTIHCAGVPCLILLAEVQIPRYASAFMPHQSSVHAVPPDAVTGDGHRRMRMS